MADATETADTSKKSGAGKLVLFIVLGLLALGGAGAGGYFFFAGSQDEAAESEEGAEDGEGKAKAKAKAKAKKSKKPSAPAIYVKVDPALVVNFESRGVTRFLQVGIEFSTRDATTAEQLKQHDPAIRNDLLLLLAHQDHEALGTREGKDKLRANALEAVRAIVDNEGGDGKKVEALFFTSFVMQ